MAIGDDPWTLTVLRVAPECIGGFEADPYLDPRNGLVAALEPDVSALVVDHGMPGMASSEIVRQVPAVRPCMPILVATAYASVEGAVSALRAGASDFIQKPLDPHSVVRSLEALIVRLCNVQLEVSRAGRPALLEVNHRPAGTLPLTVAAGVDMPVLAVADAIGEPVARLDHWDEIAVVRCLEDIVVSAEEISPRTREAVLS